MSKNSSCSSRYYDSFYGLYSGIWLKTEWQNINQKISVAGNSLLFCQLGKANSLNEITIGLACYEGKLIILA